MIDFPLLDTFYHFITIVGGLMCVFVSCGKFFYKIMTGCQYPLPTPNYEFDNCPL